MTFIAVRCPHCQSDQIVKRGKTARGTQRYLCQNTLCTKGSSLNLLQSRGGSLRLPLLQNGACPFPSTPLLSVLMLVTHTVREIVPMLPCLRIVAVSMQRVEVCPACVTAIAIDMVNFNPILIVEEQPTIGTA